MRIKATVAGASHAAALEARMKAAIPMGLVAGGNVIRNAVRRELRGGYTSSLGNHGNFVTGASVNHVALSPVTRSGRGWMISVGTDLLYNLFWELGHHNLFTRQYERDEKWSPAFQKSRRAAVQAFHRVMKLAITQYR